MRVVRIKAKKIHGIVEAVTFISIILSCFFLVLKTSFLQESVSRDSSCIGPRGFAKGIFNLFFEKDDAVVICLVNSFRLWKAEFLSIFVDFLR